MLARMRAPMLATEVRGRPTFLQNNDDADSDAIRGTRANKEDWHEQA